MKALCRHLWGVWMKRCPRCLQGAIYKSGMTMNTRCPSCGLPIEREEGYFMGSLYISYALASLILGLGTLAISFAAPEWDLGVDILLAGALFLPFVPAVTRYSRII